MGGREGVRLATPWPDLERVKRSLQLGFGKLPKGAVKKLSRKRLFIGNLLIHLGRGLRSIEVLQGIDGQADMKLIYGTICKKEGQTRKGRQVYLGGYDMEDKAARAYDLAALKDWGPSTHINFQVKAENLTVESY